MRLQTDFEYYRGLEFLKLFAAMICLTYFYTIAIVISSDIPSNFVVDVDS